MEQEAVTRVAVLGCGFWAQFQIAAWHELPGVRVVALYNRTLSKANALATRFGIPSENCFDDADELLAKLAGQIDVVDIITDVDTHARFTELAARHKLDVICQKPMAPMLSQARVMVKACRDAGVRLFVHENWRFQHPILEVKRVVNSGVLGDIFRARIDMVSGFEVFANQPFLGELDQFILTDMGSHILDVARSLFGEAQALTCHTMKVHPQIKGEDCATVLMNMGPVSVSVNLGYSGSHYRDECFPQTTMLIEGSKGTLRLDPEYRLSITLADGTHTRRVAPPRYAWADPQYDVVHASIVECNRDLLAALKGQSPAQTTATDNLRTVNLVFAAYESARTGRTVTPALD